MALKDRLKTLKRQAGQEAPEPPAVTETAPAAPAFADRVERLRPGMAAPPVRPERFSIEEVAARVGGVQIAEGLIRIEKRLPLATRHGSIPLGRLLDDHGGLPEAAGLAAEQALFIDTETTGLSGGTGTVVFLLGLARLLDGELSVRQYLITAFGGERPMLEDAAAWIEGSSALVSYNGKSFDLPLLTARARLLRTADPFAGFDHLDLLHPTRRAFGRRWLDCRMATVERQLLGFRRIDDLPGAEAPAAWFAWLHGGDAGRLPGVVEHNHWDVVSLAALLPALADVHREPHRHGADPLAIARAALKQGDEPAAFRILSHNAPELEEAGLLELARLYRGRGDWQNACAIWERLADAHCSEALERLAKYYEHECHDPARALTYAKALPPSAERDQRCRRLLEKINPAGSLLIGRAD